MKRNATLDILRAAAIILVVNAHTAFTLGADGLVAALRIGGKGVDLFFVLSGWLLGYQLLVELRDSRTINLPRFWYRRWLRTLPAYYAVLLLTFAWQAVRSHVLGQPYVKPQWSYLVFVQNYQSHLPYFGVSWSLCVEEYFYLAVAPALLVFFRFRFVRPLIVPLLLLPVVCRAMNWYRSTDETHVRYDECAVGVVLAAVAVFAPAAWARLGRVAPFLGAAALVVLLLPFVTRLYPPCGVGDFDPLVWALLFGVFVLLADSSPFYRERLRSRFFRYMADRAYAIYSCTATPWA